MRKMQQPRVRPERTSLIPVEGLVEHVLPSGEQEIAELLEISLDDLTNLPFGVGRKSRLWMSRSRQHDETVPMNRAASHGLRLNGLNIAVRGSVIVHHQEHDFGRRRSP